MSRSPAPLEQAYARLLEAEDNELRGATWRMDEWLGCNPDSLRAYAKRQGRRVSISYSRGRCLVKLVPEP